MARRFEGKNVFITGVSSGIGMAVALEMARQGARIALAARRLDRLEEVHTKIQVMGGESAMIECDVRSRVSLGGATVQAAKELGGIDIVMANAGYGVVGAFEKLDVDAFRQQFATNFFGVLDTLYAALPFLLESKCPQIVLVSSVAGRVASPLSSPYCSSKFAVYGLAESLYYELGARGIAVTCISPGFVRSEIRHVDNQGVYHPEIKDPVPSFLVVSPERAARAIVRAVYKRKFDAVITGHGKLIVWFNRHFPRTLRALCRIGMRNIPGPFGKPKRAKRK